jgi:branched-chain amino acid transport system permease protein
MIFFFQNVINAVSLGGLDALIALGIAVLFSIMKLVNFAHGELIMIGGYTLFLLHGAPLPFTLIAVVLVVVFAALLMERTAFRTVRSADPATLLVTSFAISFLLQNVVLVTMGAQAKSVALPDFVTSSIAIAGLRVANLDLLTIAVTVVLLAALVAFLRRTALGVQMRAAAEDFQMARLLGVRANRVVATAFAISGALAGVVSTLYVSRTAALDPTMGVQPVLVGFVACVIGGLGSLSGAALGGFLLGIVTVALQVLLPIELRPSREAFSFVIVVAVLLLRPHGLLGARWLKERV